MIVAERKPFDEILETIAPYGKVLVLGCGGCVSVCLTGGERQAEELASQLRMAAKARGKELTVAFDCITRQCEKEFYANLKQDPKQYDAVISIACGVGPQYMIQVYPELRVLPGMNTTHLAANVAKGIWEEYCRGCGDCALAWTGGICPVAKCSKGLINGTCGGTNKGMCEVKSDMPCGWLEIYKRLKQLGQMDNYAVIRKVRDHRKDRGNGVRRLVLKDMVEEEAAK